MEQQSSQISYLFDSIPVSNQEDINLILDNIEEPQAFFYLIQSLEYAFSKGVFSLQESELVSKSIRTLTSKKGVTKKTDKKS